MNSNFFEVLFIANSKTARTATRGQKNNWVGKSFFYPILFNYCGSLRHMELVCQREITGSSTESWFASFDNGIKARRELWRVRNELKCHHNRKVEFHWEKFFVVRNAQKYASFWQFLFRAIFSQIWILFELFQVSFNIPLDCL